jgi:hypothetical protein
VDINFEAFLKHDHFVVFDLAPYLAESESNWDIVQHGNLQLQLEFRTALPSPVTLLILGEFDTLVSIDYNRQVHVTV